MTTQQSTRLPYFRQIQLACAHCGKAFSLAPSRVKGGIPNYCSRPCSAAAHVTPEAIARRFWAKVRKNSVTGCWLWLGKCSRQGYGSFRMAPSQGGKMAATHRFAYELLVGPVPEGLWVLHNCPAGDNPSCVNPAHLFLGTHDDNMKDMARKGRSLKGRGRNPEHVMRGECHPLAKLSDADVIAIREAYASGATLRELASRYPVHHETIRRVAKGQKRAVAA